MWRTAVTWPRLGSARIHPRAGPRIYLWYQFVPVNSTATNCTFTMTPGDHILSGTYNDANTSPTGSPSSYNVDTLDSTIGRACQTYHYNWSSDLGANSYFDILAGEVHQTTIPNFGQVTISGIIYDNHYNGGPPGHCISTPYNNGWANSFTIISGGHKATESLDSGIVRSKTTTGSRKLKEAAYSEACLVLNWLPRKPILTAQRGSRRVDGSQLAYLSELFCEGFTLTLTRFVFKNEKGVQYAFTGSDK